MIAVLTGWVTADGHPLSAPLPRRTELSGWAVAAVLTIAILMCAIYFLPLWRADVVNYSFWRSHMWLPSWI